MVIKEARDCLALNPQEQVQYVAATHRMKEDLWLWNLLAEVFEPLGNAMTLFSDNQSVIVLTCDHQFHACTKHINMHYL